MFAPLTLSLSLALLRSSGAETQPQGTTPSTLVVQAVNFYGEALPGVVEAYRHEPPAAGGEAQPSKPEKRSRTVPHTTLPVVPPRAEGGSTAAAETRPAGTGEAEQPTPATTAGEAGGMRVPVARAPTGQALSLEPGHYDILVNRAGVVLRGPDVEVQAGQHKTLTVQFGALKVTGATAPLGVIDADGNWVALARPGATVHLAPGTYGLRDQGSERWVRTDITVRAGDLELVEFR